jgi:hypothetical protein
MNRATPLWVDIPFAEEIFAGAGRSFAFAVERRLPERKMLFVHDESNVKLIIGYVRSMARTAPKYGIEKCSRFAFSEICMQVFLKVLIVSSIQSSRPFQVLFQIGLGGMRKMCTA